MGMLASWYAAGLALALRQEAECQDDGNGGDEQGGIPCRKEDCSFVVPGGFVPAGGGGCGVHLHFLICSIRMGYRVSAPRIEYIIRILFFVKYV